jgi:hypothetical protein
MLQNDVTIQTAAGSRLDASLLILGSSVLVLDGTSLLLLGASVPYLEATPLEKSDDATLGTHCSLSVIG